MNRPSHPFNIRHRDIFAIALPASVAFITEPLVGIVDIAIIGRLGDAGFLGGLGLGAATFDLVFAMAFFLRLGTAGLTAQAVGAKQANHGLVHLIRAAFVGIVLGSILLLLSPVIKNIGIALFAPPTSGVADAFKEYLEVRIWSAPFVLLNFAFLGWFYGRGAAKTGMVLQIGLNLINIIFSIWFVYGLNWGVTGVAAGTVLAEGLTVIAALLVVIWQAKGFQTLTGSHLFKHILNIADLRRLFQLSRDLMIQSLVLSGAFVIFTAQISRSGELVLASSAILLNFMMITAFFLDGQAQAAEFYCGKAVGANYRPAFEQGWNLSALWGLVIGFFLFVFWLIAGPGFVDLLTTNIAVQQAAKEYLFIASLISFTGVLAFVMDGVMFGATMNKVLRNGMVLSFAVYVAAIFPLERWLGLTGLWLSLHVFFMARGVIYWVWVKRKYRALFS